MKIEEIQKSLEDIESKLTDIKKSENKNIEKSLENIKNELQKIHQDEFNIMDVFGINRRELSHSAFLAWLLNPSETHDLGNAFLKGFLEKMVDKKLVDKKQINNISFEKVKVVQEESGEESKPDIIVSNETFFLLIENKIDSSEGRKQTETLFKNFHNAIHLLELFIYLTPTGNSPECKEFKPLDYYDIKEILTSLPPKNDNTEYIIKQYVKNLEVNRLIKFEKLSDKSQLHLKYCKAIKELEDAWKEDITSFVKTIGKEIETAKWYDKKNWQIEVKPSSKDPEVDIWKNNWVPRENKGLKIRLIAWSDEPAENCLKVDIYVDSVEFREKFLIEFNKELDKNRDLCNDFERDKKSKTRPISRYISVAPNGEDMVNRALEGIDEIVKKFAVLIDKCI